MDRLSLEKGLHLPQWNFLIRDKQFRDSCKIVYEFMKGYVNKYKSISKKEDKRDKS